MNFFKIVYLVAILVLVGCSQSAELGLSGKLISNDIDTPKLYLHKIEVANGFYSISEATIIDSAIINENGQFSFPKFNELDTGFVYRLNIELETNSISITRDYQHNNYIFLVNNLKPIVISGNADKLSQSYSIANLRSESVNQFFIELRNTELPLYELNGQFASKVASANNDPAKLGQLRKAHIATMTELLFSKLIPHYKKLVKKNTDPRLISILLNHIDFNGNINDDAEYIDSVISALPPSSIVHPYIKWWTAELDEIKAKANIGDKAPNISLKSVSGETMNLHDIKAKLILVDFWASWCGPCRAESRDFVLPLYKTYKASGFEVFGVSSDSDHDKWKKAILKDGSNWIQTIITSEDQEKIELDFKVNSLPTTYLLDADYKILKYNLRGNELEDYIDSYFKLLKK